MTRRAGAVVHTHTGNITVINKLFMVRGGTLKITPSMWLPNVFLNLLFLIKVRYSQIKLRCQFHSSGCNGSRIGQACSTNFFRLFSQVDRSDLCGTGVAAVPDSSCPFCSAAAGFVLRSVCDTGEYSVSLLASFSRDFDVLVDVMGFTRCCGRALHGNRR